MGMPELAAALCERYPWVTEADIGPCSVVAGECDRCGTEARLVAPCGPPPPGMTGPDWALGRRCAAALGEDAWCEGHAAEAGEVLAWLARLPAEADDVARLWWVASGEITLDPALVGTARRLALPVLDGRNH